MLCYDSHCKDEIPYQRVEVFGMSVRENAEEQVVVSSMVSKLILSKAQTSIFQSQQNSMAAVLAVLEPAYKRATKVEQSVGLGHLFY